MKTFYTIVLMLGIIGFRLNGQSYSVIGKAWAKTSVNTAIFRKNSLVTHDSLQYAAFYDTNGRVVLAKRTIGSDEWSIKKTACKGNVKDAHNIISIMVDGNGYLHMAWGHHNNPLNYCRSVAPGSLELTDRMAMVGNEEEKVTYPEFYKMPDGDLLFLYRSGISGMGNLVINAYDVKGQTWRRLQDILIDGEGQRNAYWQAFVDFRGHIHISWTWRETSAVETNHDLCYAVSKDGGASWQKSNGMPYELPITLSSSEVVCTIPQNSGLINQTSMCVGPEGNPYVVSYWFKGLDAVPQYRLVYKTDNSWHTVQVSDRKTTFALTGGGTKKTPISRPQVIAWGEGKNKKVAVLFRDAERGQKVSLAISQNTEFTRWEYVDLSDFSVGDWEPTFDTELWKTQNKLNVFVQFTGQGDAETMIDMEAQDAMVLQDIPLDEF
jgi:hypothetical protein